MGIAILCALVLSTIASQANPSQKLVEMYVRNGIAELGLDPRSIEGREKIARLTEGVRNELRDRALVYEEARRRGLPIDEAQPGSRAKWIARLGGERGYRAYLAEHHLSDAEFQRVIEYEIAGELLREELTRELQVSEAEIIAFYEAGRKDPKLEALFVAAATVTAGHILIAARPGLHTDLEERRARAERIRQELVAGRDFAEMARRYSEDPGTSDRGGVLGTFTRDTHTDAFDAAAFALAPGDISPVVTTEYGFHIIRVTAKAPRRIRTLDELRPVIRERLKVLRSADHLAAWLQRERARTIPSTHRERQ